MFYPSVSSADLYESNNRTVRTGERITSYRLHYCELMKTFESSYTLDTIPCLNANTANHLQVYGNRQQS